MATNYKNELHNMTADKYAELLSASDTINSCSKCSYFKQLGRKSCGNKCIQGITLWLNSEAVTGKEDK